MSQANKYPNYPYHEPRQIDYWTREAQKLIDSMQRRGLVLTVEAVYDELAMGHYKLVPFVRGARTLAQGSAANRAMAAAGIDPLLLVPIHAQFASHCYCLDDAKSERLRNWFIGNGFTVATMAQLVDACYSSNLNPRGFEHFKTTQHAITLPQRNQP